MVFTTLVYQMSTNGIPDGIHSIEKKSIEENREEKNSKDDIRQKRAKI